MPIIQIMMSIKYTTTVKKMDGKHSTLMLRVNSCESYLQTCMHFHYAYDISQEHGKTILVYKLLILINAKFYSYISIVETKEENIFMKLIGKRTILFPTSTSGYFI